MSVVITIDIESLISDIKIKSFMNTERIADPEHRYAVRAAEENESETHQSLQDAWSSLKSLCRKFLADTTDTAGNDTLGSTWTGSRTLTFDVTYRRTSNFAEPLAQQIHEFLVAGTLRRFYTSAAMNDLAVSYAANEKAAGDQIVRIIYTKDEPIYT